MIKSVTTFIILALIAHTAQAADRYGPYFGMGYVASSLGNKNGTGSAWASEHKSVEGFAGFNMNEHLAVEVGYNSSNNENKVSGTSNTDLIINTLYLDTILRLHQNERASILLSMGVADIELDGVVNAGPASLGNTKKSSGTRFGAGYEFRFTNNISARIKANYTSLDFEEFDHIIQYSTGLSFNF